MFSPGSLKFKVAFRGRVGRMASWAQGAARAKLLGRKDLCPLGLRWVKLCVGSGFGESGWGSGREEVGEDRAGGRLRLLWML